MAGLPFIDDAAPTASMAPAVEITFGSSAGSGGFGGLADAATSLLGGAGAPAWADHLVALDVRLGFAPQVDHAELLIAETAGAPSAALGDSGQIRIGPRGALQDLFSGNVLAIERRGDGLRRYQLGNAGHKLSQMHCNQTLTNTTVQDAIAFAANGAGVNLEARIGGRDGGLPRYVFDDGRNLWEHIARLAALRGFNAWVDAAGTLQLSDQLEQGDTVQSFVFGRDVLALNLWQRSPHSGQITAFGGGRVDDGYTLRKQAAPNRSQVGDGPPQRYYRDGALQSQDDLSARVAAATLFGRRLTTTGELLLPGSATLAPGRVVAVEAPPDGSGAFLILAAQHRFDRRDGWRTRLSVSEAGGMPGSGSPLDALGGLP
ncbi:MAG: hypothetical protein FJ189_08765 [Gammaproteobacteria bacterium]|nr:hypothetical protein [Gammaproteobacteria bacterium]